MMESDLTLKSLRQSFASEGLGLASGAMLDSQGAATGTSDAVGPTLFSEPGFGKVGVVEHFRRLG